eukprot:3354543-Pyramimonas_sp.AAC.1
MDWSRDGPAPPPSEWRGDANLIRRTHSFPSRQAERSAPPKTPPAFPHVLRTADIGKLRAKSFSHRHMTSDRPDTAGANEASRPAQRPEGTSYRFLFSGRGHRVHENVKGV